MSKKTGSLLLSLCLLAAGCSSGNTHSARALNSGQYSAILPYDAADMRVKHVGLLSDLDVRTQVENGLMELSKQWFPPEENGFKNHVFLDYDELDATDFSRGLLGTLRDDNPNGLNPPADEAFDTGNGTVTNATIVVDLYELDFYASDRLTGISLGLVVNDALDLNGERVEITPEKMNAYIEVTASKLVTYMRQRFNDISASVPILVAAYELNTDPDAWSKGGYIYEGYFNGTSGSFQAISQNHVLVPSADFTKLDETMAAEFEDFRNKVKSVLPDYTYVTGEASFNDDACSVLKLTVESHGKTAGEILAVVQSVKQELASFQSLECTYIVQIENNDQMQALLRREAGSTDVHVLTTFQ